MRTRPYDEGRVLRYLVWTFSIAFVIQAGVGALAASGNALEAQIAMGAMMLVPAIGTLLCDTSLSDVGMRPRLRANARLLVLAWFCPLAFTALGAILYFLVFPSHFDLTGQYLVASAGPEATERLAQSGVTIPVAVLIGSVAAVTYAPLTNCLLAAGEEIGWRGFLYPQLKQRYGRVRGLVLGGLVWGMWHWPLIGGIGYNYGVGYAGFPVTGMLLMCAFTTAAGIVCDWLYERTGTIWAPSVFHGAMNAAASLPLLLCAVDTGSARLAGPAPCGIIAGLPLMAAAVAIVVRGGRQGSELEDGKA